MKQIMIVLIASFAILTIIQPSLAGLVDEWKARDFLSELKGNNKDYMLDQMVKDVEFWGSHDKYKSKLPLLNALQYIQLGPEFCDTKTISHRIYTRENWPKTSYGPLNDFLNYFFKLQVFHCINGQDDEQPSLSFPKIWLRWYEATVAKANDLVNHGSMGPVEKMRYIASQWIPNVTPLQLAELVELRRAAKKSDQTEEGLLDVHANIVSAIADFLHKRLDKSLLQDMKKAPKSGMIASVKQNLNTRYTELMDETCDGVAQKLHEANKIALTMSEKKSFGETIDQLIDFGHLCNLYDDNKNHFYEQIEELLVKE